MNILEAAQKLITDTPELLNFLPEDIIVTMLQAEATDQEKGEHTQVENIISAMDAQMNVIYTSGVLRKEIEEQSLNQGMSLEEWRNRQAHLERVLTLMEPRLPSSVYKLMEVVTFYQSKAINDIIEDGGVRKIDVNVNLLLKTSKCPVYGHKTDAGAYLFSTKEVQIPPGTDKAVRLGIIMQIPNEVVGIILPIKEMQEKDLVMVDSFKLLNSGFIGEHSIIFRNNTDGFVTIKKGEKICQIMFVPFYNARFIEVTDIEAAKKK